MKELWVKIRTWVHDGLEKSDSKQFLGVQLFVSAVTIVSIISIVLESVQSFKSFTPVYLFIEWFTAIVFTVEYISRIIVEEHKLKYIVSFWGFIDIVSILPTFLGLGNLTFLKSVRVLRVLRLARILRMAKISEAYLYTHHSRAKTQRELNKINIAIYFLALSSVTVFLGSVFHIVEQTTPAYADIPQAMYQVLKILIGGASNAAATSTPLGAALVLFTGLVGLILFGLIINIVGGFINEWLLGTEKV
jgi:voltage-gated potassium channel